MQDFQVVLFWFLVVSVILVLAVVVWYSQDMQVLALWNEEVTKADAAGDLNRVVEINERILSSCRPFIWRFRTIRMPGVFELRHAMFLHTVGQNTDALKYAEIGLRKFPEEAQAQARRVKSITLNALGRYSEACEMISCGEDPSFSASGLMGSIYLNQGKTKEALEWASKAVEEEPGSPPILTMASILLAIGSHAEVAETIRQSEGIRKLPMIPNADELEQSIEGREMLARIRESAQAINEPTPFVLMAMNCLDQEDPKAAEPFLDKAQEALQENPFVNAEYHKCRALWSALHGDQEGAEQSLASVWQNLEPYEYVRQRAGAHGTAGNCYSRLGQHDKGLTELTKAVEMVIHPIDRHQFTCDLAQAHLRAGNRAEAKQLFEKVIADGFETAASEQAAERLREL